LCWQTNEPSGGELWTCPAWGGAPHAVFQRVRLSGRRGLRVWRGANAEGEALATILFATITDTDGEARPGGYIWRGANIHGPAHAVYYGGMYPTAINEIPREGGLVWLGNNIEKAPIAAYQGDEEGGAAAGALLLLAPPAERFAPQRRAAGRSAYSRPAPRR
jgi:hypothetical protein